MNILYELDNNFASQVCASMVSACENNTSVKELNFFIFGLGLSEAVRQNLCSLGQRYARTVTVIAIDGFMEEFGEFDTLGWNEVVMGRLLMARFLPKDVNRVLYLDGDTIVRGNLAELDAHELPENKVLGAVIEPTVDRRRLSGLGISDEPYFNSGVLLIDLLRWRMCDSERRLLDYCISHSDSIVAPDQDAINGALKSRIEPLPPTYNYCNTYEFYPYRTLKKLMGNLPYYSEKAVKEAVDDPCIVHYLGEERPWREGNTHTYCDEYKHYLSMTPYSDTPDETGWRSYFRAWRLFNAVMRPVPMLRYRIITGLIPMMLSMRKKKRQREQDLSGHAQ